LAVQISQDILRLMRAIIDGLTLVVRLCYSNSRLQCLDPPVFTSPMLRRLGYGEYELRRLWRIARGRSTTARRKPVVLYNCCSARFEIEPIVKHEVAYHHRQTMTPVDYVDCRVLGEDCLEATHANKFYLYIRGHVEDNILRINVAHLLALIARRSWGEVESLLRNARRFLEADNVEKLAVVSEMIEAISRIAAERRHIIEALVPRVPHSLHELLRVSPAAREVVEVVRLHMGD
jgi:hypothetical protein